MCWRFQQFSGCFKRGETHPQPSNRLWLWRWSQRLWCIISLIGLISLIMKPSFTEQFTTQSSTKYPPSQSPDFHILISNRYQYIIFVLRHLVLVGSYNSNKKKTSAVTISISTLRFGFFSLTCLFKETRGRENNTLQNHPPPSLLFSYLLCCQWASLIPLLGQSDDCWCESVVCLTPTAHRYAGMPLSLQIHRHHTLRMLMLAQTACTTWSHDAEDTYLTDGLFLCQLWGISVHNWCHVPYNTTGISVHLEFCSALISGFNEATSRYELP